MANIRFFGNITPQAVQFENASGTETGRIGKSGDDLTITNAVGDVLFGDGLSDVYIGNGISSVDLLFEQSGAISAAAGSSITLTIGSADTTLALYAPTITNISTQASESTALMINGSNVVGTRELGSNAFNSAAYLLDTTDTFTGSLTIAGDIRGNGQELILNAGESYAYATGQTNEYVYANAESGLEINSSPDNWATGWAGRLTTSIGKTDGSSSFPGAITMPSGSKLFFDGGGNTYINEDIADRLRFFVGGAEFMRFTEDTANLTSFFQPSAFSSTVTAPTFLGDLNGTINTATTGVTQTAGNNSTKIATTAYADAAAAAVPIGNYVTIGTTQTITGAKTFTNGATFGSGVTLTESTDRADLLYINSATSTWGGLQIGNTSNEFIFSLMGDGNIGGIYDDINSDWIIQWDENSAVRLYHNANEKLATTSTGVTVSGVVTATGGNSTEWNTAYDNRITNLTTNGTSGAATLISNVLNIPNYADGQGVTSILTTNGITGGPITTTGTLQVDSTVLRTSSDQSASGIKTFTTRVKGDVGTPLDTFMMPQNPEGKHVSAPWFFNDMAYARLKGATVSVVVNGGSAPSTADIDAMLDASTGFWNMSTAGVTSVVITMSSLPKNMSFGSYMGLTFGNTHWRAKNITLESYYNGQWNTLETYTNQTEEFVIKSYNSSSNAQTQLRYTLSNFNTSSMRIVSLFAYNYNATGMPSLYATLDGFSMYGQVDMNQNKIIDLPTPTATTDAANKAYVDDKTWNWNDITTGTPPTFNQNTTGSAATLTTARTLAIGSTGKTFNGSANVSWTLAEIGAQAAGSYITGTGAATRVAFWNGTSSLTSDVNLYWDNTNDRLGIGTDNPSDALHVASSGGGIRIQDTSATDNYGLIRFGGGDLDIYSRNGSSYGDIQWWRDNGTAAQQMMRLQGSDRTLRLYAYGSGNITGTATKMLAVTAAGIIVEETLPTSGGGTVTGVGGTAPIFSSGGTAPDISITAATTSAAGSMSAADKTKLDGIATGAQVNVGTNIAQGTRTTTTVPVTSSTGTNATLAAATTSLAGVMTSADKTKLNGIATGAQVNVATNLTYTTAATTGTVNSSTGTNATVPAATTALAGLLTGADKTKLDGIAPGANTGTVTSVTAGSGMTQTGTSTVNPTLNVIGGTGITANADDVAITYVGSGNAILAATDSSGTTISTGAKIWFSDDGTIAQASVSDLPFTNTAGTVTSVGGTGTVSGLTLTGTVTSSGNLTLGGTLTLTSGNITTGLGFTPYNATNPAGYTSNTGDITAVTAGTNLNGGGTSGGVTINLDNDISLNTVEYTYPTSNSQFYGEIVTFGAFEAPGFAAGELICLGHALGNPTWRKANNTVATESTGMLGIALGSSPSAGILVRGFARSTAYNGFSDGGKCYISATDGDMTTTAPTATNAYLRIVGYVVDSITGAAEIYFCPDNTYVQIT